MTNEERILKLEKQVHDLMTSYTELLRILVKRTSSSNMLLPDLMTVTKAFVDAAINRGETSRSAAMDEMQRIAQEHGWYQL